MIVSRVKKFLVASLAITMMVEASDPAPVSGGGSAAAQSPVLTRKPIAAKFSIDTLMLGERTETEVVPDKLVLERVGVVEINCKRLEGPMLETHLKTDFGPLMGALTEVTEVYYPSLSDSEDQLGLKFALRVSSLAHICKYTRKNLEGMTHASNPIFLLEKLNILRSELIKTAARTDEIIERSERLKTVEMLESRK